MSIETGFAPSLGALAGRVETSTMPHEVLVRARAVIADVLAVAIAGSDRQDIHRLAVSFSDGSGSSTIIASRASGPPLVAGAINALPIAAQQLQDGHRRARGHPGSHVVPAVLAVAEHYSVTGHALLAAVVSGYEVGVRIGIAMGGTPDGVHDIGTWATIGAAAGVAHLLSGGDSEQIVRAIELAASLPLVPDASGVFSGHGVQHLLLGSGVFHAIWCGQAAVAGITAPPGRLESHFARFSANDWHIPADSVLQDQTWTILDGYLKRHPTCAHLHGVNDAVEDILRAGPIDLADIHRVEVATYSAAARFDSRAPANDLAARFSIPWTVAAALRYGRLDDDCFTSTALEDEQIRRIAAGVSVRVDAQLDAGYPAGRPARVTIHLRHGCSRQAEADLPRGDGPSALEDAAVRDKPRVLMTRHRGEEYAGRVCDVIDRLPDAPIGELTAALRSS